MRAHEVQKGSPDSFGCYYSVLRLIMTTAKFSPLGVDENLHSQGEGFGSSHWRNTKNN